MSKSYFKKGESPHNKIITEEHKVFLKNNYKILNNVELGKVVGVTSKHVYDVLCSMGIKRTKDEVKALISKCSSEKDNSKASFTRLKIEGGGRKSTLKVKWHREKWTKINGDVSKKQILVYKNANYDSFEDLILIQKRHYESFLRKRDKRLNKIKKENKMQGRTYMRKRGSERRKIEEKFQQEFLEMKSNHVQKNFTESVISMQEEGKVPVHIDEKTTLWVNKNKCYQDEEGLWHKIPKKEE